MEVAVRFPANFQNERSYTLKVLFSYFKNVDLVLVPEERTDYLVSWKERTLIIEDHFWKESSENEIDQVWQNTPKNPEVLNIPELKTSFISIYGSPEIVFKDTSVHLKSDIISSTFFFLSRWEEWISNERDEHDRFPDKENYLIKHGLQRRPVVNEYIEFFRLLLSEWTSDVVEYNRKYEVYVTHDVDEIYRYRPTFKWLKAVGGDILLRKDVISAFKSFSKGLLTQFSSKFDDSQTFDYFMDISEKYNLKSYFYFIPGEKGEKDFRYSVSSTSVKNLIEHIHQRDHVIGIHPSYRSKEEPTYFEEEVRRLRGISPANIEEGRHHYLRMNFPTTINEWKKNGLKTDSSLGFSEYAGFRAGICYEFPIFNLDKRAEMEVTERPLTVMEVALEHNTDSYQQFIDQVQELASIVQKYKGDFVLLWHNNNIHHPAWKKLGCHYEDVIKCIAK